MAATAKQHLRLLAHLLRRAGFGATYEELERYAAKGYEATVEELLHPEGQRESPQLDEDLLLRFRPTWIDQNNPKSSQTLWLYRMINTRRPLLEKVALFWHGVHCTGYAKVDHFKELSLTIDMFRCYGLGSFRTLLIELTKNPGMNVMLDNHMSHKGAINENWARELLELFSIGGGSYTEDDVKQAARGFYRMDHRTCSAPVPIWPFAMALLF